jgi:solute carrier family 25 (mitochondrial carnitine/acylcarnitine transporter), member 20/29
MQTMGSMGGGSVFGLLRQTFVESGVRGLYRGVSAPLIAVTPIFALSFWGYDMGQRLVTYGTGHETLSMAEKCVAGGLSGIPTTLLMAPSERVKVLMQTGTKYTSMSQCAYQLVREGGFSSLFRGTTLTLVRDVPGSMAWFGTYELVKQTLSSMQGYTDPSQLSPLAVVTAGGFAGMACWTVSIPADVLKSRLQSAPEGTYNGSLHVLRQLLQTEGPAALFTGIRPALIRAFPANAACFSGMELAKKGLSYFDTELQ